MALAAPPGPPHHKLQPRRQAAQRGRQALARCARKALAQRAQQPPCIVHLLLFPPLVPPCSAPLLQQLLLLALIALQFALP